MYSLEYIIAFLLYISGAVAFILIMLGLAHLSMGNPRVAKTYLVGGLTLALIPVILPPLMDYIFSGYSVFNMGGEGVFIAPSSVVATPGVKVTFNVMNLNADTITARITFLGTAKTTAFDNIFGRVAYNTELNLPSGVTSTEYPYTWTVIHSGTQTSGTGVITLTNVEIKIQERGSIVARALAYVINGLLGIGSDIGSQIWKILPIPSPVIVMMFLTIMPTTDMLYNFSALYNTFLQVGIILFVIASIVNVLFRAWDGDSRLLENFLKDMVISLSVMFGGYYFYDLFASIINSIVIAVGTTGITYGVTMITGFIGLSLLFLAGTLIPVIGEGFAWIGGPLLVMYLTLTGMALFRFAALLAMALMMPITGALMMAPPLRNIINSNISFIINEGLKGLALAVMLTIIASMDAAFGFGDMMKIAVPILLLLAPTMLTQLGGALVGGSLNISSFAAGTVDTVRGFGEKVARGRQELVKRYGKPESITPQRQKPEYPNFGLILKDKNKSPHEDIAVSSNRSNLYVQDKSSTEKIQFDSMAGAYEEKTGISRIQEANGTSETIETSRSGSIMKTQKMKEIQTADQGKSKRQLPLPEDKRKEAIERIKHNIKAAAISLEMYAGIPADFTIKGGKAAIKGTKRTAGVVADVVKRTSGRISRTRRKEATILGRTVNPRHINKELKKTKDVGIIDTSTARESAQEPRPRESVDNKEKFPTKPAESKAPGAEVKEEKIVSREQVQKEAPDYPNFGIIPKKKTGDEPPQSRDKKEDIRITRDREPLVNEVEAEEEEDEVEDQDNKKKQKKPNKGNH